MTRNRHTPAWAQASLFSSALHLPSDLWRDDDCLRFQSELHCREAQPSGGVEDCMHVTNTAVTHAANRALGMGNGSPRRRGDVRQSAPAAGILDVNAQCRGDTYVTETRHMLPEQPAPGLWAQIFTTVAC